MPWVVGIDEAGYGPNLGPLVQAAAILWMPPEDPGGWTAYSKHLRQSHQPQDNRLLIDDSKKVYQGPRKLEKLERSVIAMWQWWSVIPEARTPYSFEQMLGCDGYHVLGDQHNDMLREFWYDPEFAVPVKWQFDDAESAFLHWTEIVMPGGTMAMIPRVWTTPVFNRIVTAAGNKAEVLSRGLTYLLKEGLNAGRMGALSRPDDPIIFLCDKQGGRHFYAPLLQEAFPEGWIVADREGPAESRYRVMNLGREITVSFRPKADGDSVSVALASMLAKYLREICMLQFNAFWAKHVPGLKSTAGYPLDAKRFYAEIEPAMESLGIAKDAVWRVK